MALLLGCVMRVAYGDVHTAAARVLWRLGGLLREAGALSIPEEGTVEAAWHGRRPGQAPFAG